MGVLLIVALVAGLVFLYCSNQISATKETLRRAGERMHRGGQVSVDQNKLDTDHTPVWEAKVRTLNLVRRLSVYVGIGSLGLYVVIWALSWARVYGWIG